jgi:hypothetical protein
MSLADTQTHGNLPKGWGTAAREVTGHLMLGNNKESLVELRDRLMPRFHGCVAYAFSSYYVLYRRQSDTFPHQIDEFMHSGVFEVFFFVGLIASIITGLWIWVYLRSRTHAHSSIQKLIEEVRAQKTSYLLPHRYTILFIVFVELYLYFD